ncbi:MAG TPA: hypothetical protein VFQ05_05110 [Candidatus Eisenbacteria bacterium]|nr:hypothetical protein [Candidatus Eisenbacteria bacterium]
MVTRHVIVTLTLCALLMGIGVTTAGAVGGSFGAGLHYLRNLGDIKAAGFDQNSYSLVGAYKYDAGLLKVEGTVDYIFDYVGTGEPMWEPAGWGLVGNMIYGGAGIGIGYTDGDWQKNPFYALRAGVALPLGDLGLDVFGTYRFQTDAELKELTGEDLDSVTFCALVRF